jgi:hypothetical protein
MSRPHEDIEHHTLVDHRPGGAAVSFAPGAWCALEIANVEASRVDAGISAYETLIEMARTSSTGGRPAALLRSDNRRRVIAFVEAGGHQAFGHIVAAWGDRRLQNEHRAVAESTSLALYRVVARVGQADIDPASEDAYAFERAACEPQRARAIVPPLVAAAGFRGALVFGSDDTPVSVILYRFQNEGLLEAFRSSPKALAVLGAVGAPMGSAPSNEDTFHAVRPVKTFSESTPREA